MNPLHREFAKEYLETGNGTQSILKVDPEITSPESAAVKASRLLRNDKVRAYLEDKAEKAATRVEQLMEQSENLPVSLNAAKDILDRAGFKPIDKSETKLDLPNAVLVKFINGEDNNNSNRI